MARGRRAAPGRRGGTGRGGGTPDEPEEEEEDTGTSVDDLTAEADPETFDQTFQDGDANLRIEGEFEPTAGSKQVIPRIAYVLNYNLVYNEERDRWEGQKKAGTEADQARAVLPSGLLPSQILVQEVPAPVFSRGPPTDPTSTETVPDPTVTTTII